MSRKASNGRKLIHQLFADKGFKIGAEIGVDRGENAVNMFKRIPDLMLYLVDPWAGRAPKRPFSRAERHDMAMKAIAGYNAIVLRTTSLKASLLIPDRSLDFVYIDGRHRFPMVMLDIILWEQKVRDGGITSGHDYVPSGRYGVNYAVNSYVRHMNRYRHSKNKIKLRLIEKNNWYFEK